MRNRLVMLTTTAVLVVVASLGSQSPAFEVASIKTGVSADVPAGIRPISAGGQFHAVLTLHDLVQAAYGAPLALLPSQVVGGPAWVTIERFEIIAKANGLANTSSGARDELLAMMRTLLTDRFALRVRQERRDLAIFNLDARRVRERYFDSRGCSASREESDGARRKVRSPSGVRT
jgi:uncharacterized protein (TIGR03435 family)